MGGNPCQRAGQEKSAYTIKWYIGGILQSSSECLAPGHKVGLIGLEATTNGSVGKGCTNCCTKF